MGMCALPFGDIFVLYFSESISFIPFPLPRKTSLNQETSLTLFFNASDQK